VRPYVIAQCAVGATIAAYHSYIQWFPPSAGTSFCTVEAPCTTRYVWELGFVSLPFMALVAFCSVITLMLVAGPRRVDAAEPDHLDLRDGAAPVGSPIADQIADPIVAPIADLTLSARVSGAQP
jgi:hypothetical protein